MKIKFTLLSIVIASLFAVSCKKNLNTPLRLVDVTNSGQTVTLAQGQLMDLTLGNPGDGGYDFDALQYNSSILNLGEHMRNLPPPNSPTGDFGSDTWAFRAKQAGTTTLTVTATRGTDKSSTIVIFSGTITVH